MIQIISVVPSIGNNQLLQMAPGQVLHSFASLHKNGRFSDIQEGYSGAIKGRDQVLKHSVSIVNAYSATFAYPITIHILRSYRAHRLFT
jgi:hypothetical protein